MNVSPKEQLATINRIRTSLKGAPLNVLLVEDDEGDAFITRRVLNSKNVENIAWAKTVKDACDMFRQAEFKLVFLDLKLQEGTSGLDLIKTLKETRPDSWVIVLSGAYTEDSDECKEALRLGAFAIMLKPLTPEKVEFILGNP